MILLALSVSLIVKNLQVSRKFPSIFPIFMGLLRLVIFLHFITLTITLFSSNHYTYELQYAQSKIKFAEIRSLQTSQFTFKNQTGLLSVDRQGNSHYKLLFQIIDESKPGFKMKIIMFGQDIWSTEIICD